MRTLSVKTARSCLPPLPEKGVCAVVNCGSSLEGSYESVALAERWPYVYAAVGVHPGDLLDAPADWLQQVEALLARPKVVAVGRLAWTTTGRRMPPAKRSTKPSRRRWNWPRRNNLPVVIHDREAHGDTMELLRRYRPRGVLHCFSGSVEMLREVLDLGLYVGLGGSVTFKNARVPVEVAREVPLDRLLTETDCPYLAPCSFPRQALRLHHDCLHRRKDCRGARHHRRRGARGRPPQRLRAVRYFFVTPSLDGRAGGKPGKPHSPAGKPPVRETRVRPGVGRSRRSCLRGPGRSEQAPRPAWAEQKELPARAGRSEQAPAGNPCSARRGAEQKELPVGAGRFGQALRIKRLAY